MTTSPIVAGITYVYASDRTYKFNVHAVTMIRPSVNAGLWNNAIKVVVTHNGRTFECVRNPDGGYTRTEV